MESEVIIVKNDETGLNDALDLTTELARQHQLSKKTRYVCVFWPKNFSGQ